jgi:hypothetical protein
MVNGECTGRGKAGRLGERSQNQRTPGVRRIVGSQGTSIVAARNRTKLGQVLSFDTRMRGEAGGEMARVEVLTKLLVHALGDLRQQERGR